MIGTPMFGVFRDSTWEYKNVDSPSEAEMNELGAEAWELIIAVGSTLTFKRRT